MTANQAFLGFSTLADMAGAVGPTAATIGWCDETCANYQWTPASSATVDGWTCIANTGGTNGRWILVGDTISLSPLGGTSDDWPRLFNSTGAATVMAYKGKVVLRHGTWLCKSVVSLVSGVHIVGSAGVTILSSLTPTGGVSGFANSVFFTQALSAGTATSVSTQPAIGSRTLAVAANTIAVGDQIIAQGAANVAQQFKVLAKSGSGPYTLTLDDSIEFTFPVGNSVQSMTTPSDIRIDGRGMKITGSGDRAFEIAGAQRCRVSGVRVVRDSGVVEAFGGSFDVGGRDNEFSDIEVDGGLGIVSLPTHIGLALECNVRSAVRGCRLHHVGTAGADSGVYAPTCAKCVIEDCQVWNSYIGIYLATSSAGDLQGCLKTTIVDCWASDCSQYGVLTADGSDNALVRVQAFRNALSGIYVAGVAGGCLGLGISDCVSSDNGVAGLTVTGTSSRVQTTAFTCDRNATYGIDAQAGETIVSGWASTDCVTGPWNTTNAANLTISGALVRVSINGLWFAGHAGTGVVTLRDYVVELVGSPTGVKVAVANMQAAGVVHLENVRTVGAFTYGLNANNAVACKVRRGQCVDISSSTTPWVFDAMAKANFGTFTANGTMAVTVPGYFLADQPIAISFNTLSGTRGAVPTIDTKSANSFTVKATALDNSTYDWKA